MQDFADVAVALARVSEPRLSTSDFALPGEQIPLFFGPCLYCGGGYLAELPGECSGCGTWLRRVVRPPAWALRGVRWYMLWVRWEFFKASFIDRLYGTLLELVRMQALTQRSLRP